MVNERPLREVASPGAPCPHHDQLSDRCPRVGGRRGVRRYRHVLGSYFNGRADRRRQVTLATEEGEQALLLAREERDQALTLAREERDHIATERSLGARWS
jgi:hypothetical protein